MTEVEVDHDGARETFSADIVVVSCGAANSAKLLLASATDKHPNGLSNRSDQLGRNYTFHNSQAVLALSKEENPTVFQKTLGLNDFYFGSDDYDFPLGNIQMVGKSSAPMFRGEKPLETKLAPTRTLESTARHAVDFWLSTEDLPRPENRVTLDEDGNVRLSYKETQPGVREAPLPQATVAARRTCGMHKHHLVPRHAYLKNDIPVAGCAHQAGTCRFGTEPETSVLEHRLSHPRARQPLRGRHQLLPQHRSGEPGPDRDGERPAGRGPPARAAGSGVGRRRGGRRMPAEDDSSRRPRVVIIGGGFGGLAAARKLRHADVDVTLIDRTNHHLFQPLLYQVAAGALSPSDCAAPIRPSLKRSANTTVLMDEATDVDPERRQVVLAAGDPLDYDSLIVACGARTSYFGRDEWKEVTFGLKTLQDAIDLRQHFYCGTRGGGAQQRPRRAGQVPDLRRRRRRAHRRGDRGRARAHRQRHEAPVPSHRHEPGEGGPAGRRRPRRVRVQREALEEGGASSSGGSGSRSARERAPPQSTRTASRSSCREPASGSTLGP